MTAFSTPRRGPMFVPPQAVVQAVGTTSTPPGITAGRTPSPTSSADMWQSFAASRQQQQWATPQRARRPPTAGPGAFSPISPPTTRRRYSNSSSPSPTESSSRGSSSPSPSGHWAAPYLCYEVGAYSEPSTTATGAPNSRHLKEENSTTTPSPSGGGYYDLYKDIPPSTPSDRGQQQHSIRSNNSSPTSVIPSSDVPVLYSPRPLAYKRNRSGSSVGVGSAVASPKTPTTPRNNSPRTTSSPTSWSNSTNASSSPTSTPPAKSSASVSLRLKTEMCAYYGSNKPCPYGNRCTYAHGPHELSRPKLMDLVRAGLVRDPDYYRTLPCQSFVSTGACPFGHRCTGIHDPQVAGHRQHPAWMPHCEVPVKKLETNFNVAHLHHHAVASLQHGNPFAGLIPKQQDVSIPDAATEGMQLQRAQKDWMDFYGLICAGLQGIDDARTLGLEAQRFGAPSPSPDTSSLQVLERHVLEIVLKMRGGPSDPRHKYYPTHLIKGSELCMVLQEQTFFLSPSGEVHVVSPGLAVPGASATGMTSHTIVVREIAFGPDADPSVRGVALWFGISERDITKCTQKEIDAIRKPKIKATGKNKKKSFTRGAQTNSRNVGECGGMAIGGCVNGSPSSEGESKTNDESFISSLSMPHRPFFLVRPVDDDAFKLAGSILAHRLSTLKATDAAYSPLTPRQHPIDEKDTFSALRAEMMGLKTTFESLRRHWSGFVFPTTDDRAVGSDIDDNTSVPGVDGEYIIASGPNDHAQKAWKAFVGNVHDDNGKEAPANESRLRIFEHLSTRSAFKPREKLPTLGLRPADDHTDGTGFDELLQGMEEVKAYYSSRSAWGTSGAHF